MLHNIVITWKQANAKNVLYFFNDSAKIIISFGKVFSGLLLL